MSFDVTGEAYDRFMGRYSLPLAARLADWMEVTSEQRVLDVGCGPGALTEQFLQRVPADQVLAVDPSEKFVEACQTRHPGVDVRRATAEALPFDDDRFDAAGACLVVHFMTDPVGGIAEMARVTRPGGWVAATVWDMAGGRNPMWPVWAAVTRIVSGHPGESQRPGGARGQLVEVFEGAGVNEVEGAELGVTVTHPAFEEWWQPYLNGVGPVGEALAALDPADLERVRAECHERLGDGPFDITAVAFAARGRA